MRITDLEFGSISIDGTTYEKDVVIDRGRVLERRKKPSKRYRDRYGHTPLSIEERIPWACRRLVVGTGMDGALPVMNEVRREATLRHVELLVSPTTDAIDVLTAHPDHTNAILHLTCRSVPVAPQ